MNNNSASNIMYADDTIEWADFDQQNEAPPIVAQSDNPAAQEGAEVTVTARSLYVTNFTIDSYFYNGVEYKGYTFFDILQMLETGYEPGTPENPQDAVEDVVVTAQDDQMKASEAFHWVANIMGTIKNGFEYAAYGLGIFTVAAVVDPIPGDELILGGLTAGAAGSALMAGTFADWADDMGDMYEEREKNEERRYDDPPQAPTHDWVLV